MNEKGEPIYKGKTYSNIRKEATADQVDQAAKALGSLSGNSINLLSVTTALKSSNLTFN